MKRVLFTAILTGAVAFAGSAMAESKKLSAPGYTGTSPGQTFKSTDALPPGQQLKLNREAPDADPSALAPGKGLDNWGRQKQLP